MTFITLSKRGGDTHESRQSQVLRETTPLIVLATLSVIGRLLSRRFRKVSLGADDYFIVGALIFCWGHFSLDITYISLGLGKHTDAELQVDLTPVFKAIFAGSLIYATSITLIKASILFFYQRVFPTPKFVLITRIIGGFVVAWWVVVVIIQVFSCNPIHGFWDTSTPSICVNPAHFYIAVAVPNILTDIIMLCLPVRMVWRLQTSPVQKIALSLTFLTGAFVIVASVYRILMLSVADRADPLWTYTNVVIWTTIEPCVGVVCACLPTLRPLLRKVSEYIGSTVFTDRSRTRHGQGIQLKPDYKDAQQKPFGRPSRWIDENLHFQPNKNVSRETAATSVMGGTNSERDDTLSGGINVRHDVLIERTSS